MTKKLVGRRLILIKPCLCQDENGTFIPEKNYRDNDFIHQVCRKCGAEFFETGTRLDEAGVISGFLETGERFFVDNTIKCPECDSDDVLCGNVPNLFKYDMIR